MPQTPEEAPAPEMPAPKGTRGSALVLPAGYAEMLGGLKAQVRQAQIRAQRVVNEQLIELYRNVGREILTKQDQQEWGSDALSADRRRVFGPAP